MWDIAEKGLRKARETMNRIELKDGGLIVYDEQFQSSALADRYFSDLRDHCPWERKPGVFGHMRAVELVRSVRGSVTGGSA